MTRATRAIGVTLLVLAGVAARDVAWRTGIASATEAFEAPARLADTGLYAGGRVGEIDSRNRAFSPQYPLWTDGARKARWVYLPPGGVIDGSAPDEWDFPVGTRFWKEFAFGGRRVETRMLWKASPTEWVAASYVWNDDGTDAVLAPRDGVPGVAEVAPGRRHSIPSATDCFACHGATGTRPLGFTALQLSPDRDPDAIHGEPLQPGMVTLTTLADEGLLAPRRTNVIAHPPRIQASSPQTRTVLGYLAANCGACHSRDADVPAVAPFLRTRDLLTDGDAVARALAARFTTWQAPGREDGTRLVDPDTPQESAILRRMRSRQPSSQMPPLGSVVRDDAAVEAVARWIQEVAAAPGTHTQRRALPVTGPPAPMR
jgi:mono/diheme cytochrome c family protein